MKTISFLLLPLLLFTACGGSSTSGGAISTRSCKTPRGLTNTCCTSHGGYGNQCSNGQIQYVDDTGELVCNDGTLSPTCVYSTETQEIMSIPPEGYEGELE